MSLLQGVAGISGKKKKKKKEMNTNEYLNIAYLERVFKGMIWTHTNPNMFCLINFIYISSCARV